MSDLKALSFVQVVRDLIEDSSKENLRALIEDDPKKWLLCLVEALTQVSSIAKTMSAMQTSSSRE
jgi:hypothetical protein